MNDAFSCIRENIPFLLVKLHGYACTAAGGICTFCLEIAWSRGPDFMEKFRMLEWAKYRKQLSSRVSELGRLSPATLEGVRTLGGAGQKTGRLDARTRELIALAVAVTTRCDGCIASHTAEAAKAGATREEIAEALGVAIALNAGAALVYSSRVLDAFDTVNG